jgi:hypothetical protein
MFREALKDERKMLALVGPSSRAAVAEGGTFELEMPQDSFGRTDGRTDRRTDGADGSGGAGFTVGGGVNSSEAVGSLALLLASVPGQQLVQSQSRRGSISSVQSRSRRGSISNGVWVKEEAEEGAVDSVHPWGATVAPTHPALAIREALRNPAAGPKLTLDQKIEAQIAEHNREVAAATLIQSAWSVDLQSATCWWAYNLPRVSGRTTCQVCWWTRLVIVPPIACWHSYNPLYICN